MIDDDLECKDVENTILKGCINKKMAQDIRGTRYRIESPARDVRLIHVLCRLKIGDLILIRSSFGFLMIVLKYFL